ncbi:MAG TPA: glycosyltransferase 87 family protein, partial [Planctomycetota bacterium]|nr:glycosyltransferase 87 family protein [Planctomycetota bacterium]
RIAASATAVADEAGRRARCQVATRPGTERVGSSTALRIVRLALLAALVVLVLQRAVAITRTFELGVDLEIPLRAAERWLDGGRPYDPAAFQVAEGPGLPFLYPPFLLPLLAPLAGLPRQPVLLAWVAACLLSALAACRRLGLPPAWWPLAVLWPPFLEGIWNGNVQVHLFAAFVCALFEPVPRGADGPRPRDGSRPETIGAPQGLLAALVGSLKASQVHAWLLVARLRPRAALLGALPLAAVVLLTLPAAGPGLYREWLAQADRATDPSWPPIGAPLSLLVPRPVAIAVSAASLLLVFLLPRRQAAPWTGLLLVAAAPTVHTYAWLFLLPAMLVVRREIALVAALYFASYHAAGWWLGFALVAVALGLAGRYPALRHVPAQPAGLK